MRHNRMELYAHFIWSTWDREALITPEIERDVYRCIEAESEKSNCVVLALGGVEDHVHLLLQIPTTVVIAEVVQSIKGKSARVANGKLGEKANFRWSSAYAAFSVSRWNKGQLIEYIVNQKEHHANGQTKLSLELPPPFAFNSSD